VTPEKHNPEERNTEIAPQNPRSGWHNWPADSPAPANVPFDTEKAKEYQKAWAEYLKVPVEMTNSIGMKLILIPPGEFNMGNTPENINEALKFVGSQGSHRQWQEYIRSESPTHTVVLTQPIYLSVHEVTQKEYKQIMGANPSYYASNGLGKMKVVGVDTSNSPVEMVTWTDATEFCVKLSRAEKLSPSNARPGNKSTTTRGKGYRLPTEAEWEFACRAGSVTQYWFGDGEQDLGKADWFSENFQGRTHAVGELNANPFGLYDMYGNVGEWVQDGWQSGYFSKFMDRPAINPIGAASGDRLRMTKGGAGAYAAGLIRSSARYPFHEESTLTGLGFRVALIVESH
jgi:formylglycine-generating enzyme required for sulfatase activity